MKSFQTFLSQVVLALCVSSIFAAELVAKPVPTLIPTLAPTAIPRPTIFPCPPIYTTHVTASGATERVLRPCITPDPCIWPRPHAAGASTTRLSIAYPPRCCPILYRKLSTTARTTYPLPYPCKFTPLPQPTKKPECAPCRSGSECLQGKCWGSPLKCTDGDYHGLLGCGYKKECESCTSSLQCATMKCWKSRCVFDTEESKNKCFPH